MQIFWKNAWISSLLLIFLSDSSSESEQLPGNRKTPRISDRTAQALPLRYQFFRAARMRSAVSVFYSARRKSLRADRNCHTAKNRPFRTGTPPDNCCMYLDLESLHRTGFPGRSIKSRRILPLPFFQAVPRIHPTLSFTDFVTRERLHIAENLLKNRISRSPKCRSNPVLTVFLRLTESFEIKKCKPYRLPSDVPAILSEIDYEFGMVSGLSQMDGTFSNAPVSALFII